MNTGTSTKCNKTWILYNSNMCVPQILKSLCYRANKQKHGTNVLLQKKKFFQMIRCGTPVFISYQFHSSFFK